MNVSPRPKRIPPQFDLLGQWADRTSGRRRTDMEASERVLAMSLHGDGHYLYCCMDCGSLFEFHRCHMEATP